MKLLLGLVLTLVPLQLPAGQPPESAQQALLAPDQEVTRLKNKLSEYRKEIVALKAELVASRKQSALVQAKLECEMSDKFSLRRSVEGFKTQNEEQQATIKQLTDIVKKLEKKK